MKRLMNRVSFSALAVILLGCYPQGPEYTEDLDVVYTTFDKAYDFQAVSTYAMPDQIVVDAEKDLGGDWVPEYMPDVFATPILAAIQDNMEANGWALVDIDDDPDVLLTPAAIKSTTYFYTYWYDWWYGSYYPGWGGWYYPPSYSVSSYTTGSLIMVIADPNTESPINQAQAAWVAVGNGLFTGAYDLDRAIKSIDQSFAQSPYLKIN